MYPTKYRNWVKPVNAFANFDDVITRDLFRNPWKMQWSNLPSVNVKETDGDFRIELAAPGLDKNDFKIDLEKDVLTISAEKKMENTEENDRYTRKEFEYHNFRRSFTMPENVNGENIKATYEKGVLHVVLPKKEVSVQNAKKIVVE